MPLWLFFALNACYVRGRNNPWGGGGSVLDPGASDLGSPDIVCLQDGRADVVFWVEG